MVETGECAVHVLRQRFVSLFHHTSYISSGLFSGNPIEARGAEVMKLLYQVT